MGRRLFILEYGMPKIAAVFFVVEVVKIKNKRRKNMFVEALKLLSWEGRICRWQYLIAFMLVVAIGTFFAVVSGGDDLAMAFIIPISGLLLIPSQIRRLHDIGWSGVVIFLFLIPIVNIILGFILLVAAGTKGPNKYGEDPHK